MTQNHRPRIESIPRNCSGCRLCELVCSSQHTPGVTNPKKSRIRLEVEHRENRNVPRVCTQCPEHPCLDSCPAEAVHLHPVLKVPVVSSADCTGCRACIDACPYGFMFFDEDEGVALKCDLCAGDPECVKNCPVGALSFRRAEEEVKG